MRTPFVRPAALRCAWFALLAHCQGYNSTASLLLQIYGHLLRYFIKMRPRHIRTAMDGGGSMQQRVCHVQTRSPKIYKDVYF